MTLRIVIAPSGFKESLSAEEVASCIETGIRRVVPGAAIRKVPLVDGGEGFARALAAATGGEVHDVAVTGPVGEPIQSHFALLGSDGIGGDNEGQRVAVLEMAAASGLRLVPKDARDPLQTTTFGVGELVRAALDAGAQKILIGCGDSGTNDGGAGMAQALGVRLLDEDGAELERGGISLEKLARIDISGRDLRLESVAIDVACNWHNILCGEGGVARVFGPQKGASPQAVERLERALERFAEVVERDLQIDVRTMPGGGASGGTGAGLHALLGATLHPRFEIVMSYVDLDELLSDCDLVFTAEGGLDFQTPRGKVPSEVARRAKEFGLPVVALAGTLGKGAKDNLDHGIDAFESIVSGPGTLEHAVEHAAELLEDGAEHQMRLIVVGQRLGEAQAARQADSDTNTTA